jgi:hypothetical protein
MGSFGMSSFEWMELQTLTSDIAASRSRLSEARACKDHRLSRALESEIAAAEQRRAGLLAYITTHLAEVSPLGDAETEPAGDEASQNQPQPFVDASPAPDVAMPQTGMHGGVEMWDQLTSTDLERAKVELGSRRAEMLARHAEELKTLDADHEQLDTLEQAIAAFLRKFKPSGSAAVVTLDEERELRMQNHA